MAEIKPMVPPVAAPKGSLVGDEAQPEPREVEVDAVDETTRAQVMGKPSEPLKEVPVHETRVSLDAPVLDPSSPLAVQVPDAGRGSVSLPIHQLAQPTVEQVFAQEASKADDSDADKS